MRAAVFRAVGAPLALEDLTLADPGTGEVLVETRACAICHSDISFINGDWGAVPPSVFGHEVSGVVEAVGNGVTGIRPGDRVIVSLIRSCGACPSCAGGTPVRCDGAFPRDAAPPLLTTTGEVIAHGLRTAGFADRVLVHASQVVPITVDIAFESAAVVACAVITGIGAVTNTAAIEPGATVAVVGAGGVGLNTIQGARLCDASSVIAVDVAPAKLAAAMRFGADTAINAASDDPVDAVMAKTGGRGADYVFVTVGAARAMDQGLRMTARGGATVLVGMPPNGADVPLDASTLAAREGRILGSKMGSAVLDRDVRRIFDWYDRGLIKLDELVTGRFPLERINDALASCSAPETIRNVITFESG